ncbi:MAG: hypothetical protein AAF468_22390 [Pseudomonadota bacterium]
MPTSPIDVDSYRGHLFLAVGMEDRTWSSDMTRRLEERRKRARLPVEAHYYEGEGHVPRGEAESRHHELLVSFFNRDLSC